MLLCFPEQERCIMRKLLPFLTLSFIYLSLLLVRHARRANSTRYRSTGYHVCQIYVQLLTKPLRYFNRVDTGDSHADSLSKRHSYNERGRVSGRSICHFDEHSPA